MLCYTVLAGSAQLSDFRFRHLSVRDGLSQTTAYCIAQDHLGFIWIGTDDGLNRYDGYELQIFRNDPLNPQSLSNNTVNAIQADRFNRLWVGTDQGLNLFDPVKRVFKSFRFELSDVSSLSSNTIWSMAMDRDGDLWIGTASGLNLFLSEEEGFKRFKMNPDQSGSIANNSINCLFTDSRGDLWIGTNNGLAHLVDKKGVFESYPIPEDPSRHGQAVLSIHESEDGELLIGTNHGLFELQDGMLKRPSWPQVESGPITAIMSDPDKNLWLGSKKGLVVIDEQRKEAQSIRHRDEDSDGISDDHIHCMLLDDTGIQWFGTNAGGVDYHFHEEQRILHFDRSDLNSKEMPSEQVNCIHRTDDGNLWLGTALGLGYFQESAKFQGLSFPKELEKASISCVVEDRELLAVGTDNLGVYVKSKSSEDWIKLEQKPDGSGLSDNRIADMILMADKLWIGTKGNGVNVYNPESQKIDYVKFSPTAKDGLVDNRISQLIAQGDEMLWIGTAGQGVQSYSLKSGRFTNYSIRSEEGQKLSSDKILCMTYNSAIVWVGTKGGGLNKIDLLTGTIEVYTTSDGLANNVVNEVLYDEEGRLWMTTNRGVSMLDVNNGNIVNYTELDGIGNGRFIPRSGWLSSSSEIYFGGQHGLEIIRMKDIEKSENSPRVYISQIEAFDVVNNQYDPGLSGDISFKLDRLVLPPQISLINIGFCGLNYRKPEKNTYAYRIVGLQDEWTFLGERRYVTLSELPPGEYTMQVKAANNTGQWSKPMELNLYFVPALYQRTGFWVFVALLVILSLIFFIRWRFRRVQQVNKTLEERVRLRTAQIVKERDEKAILLQEIHHRVKNNLQIVNSLLRLQSHYVKDEEALWALNESQNRVMSMAMIHERMYKTKNLANINIPQYIEDLCRDIINTYDLSNTVELDLDIKVEKLNLDTLTPLGLIINEISSNAMKYAFPEGQSGRFTVHLSAIEPGKKFRLYIGDDGVGMPVDLSDTEQDSLGTTLMESLSEQLNGELKRLDTPGTVYEMLFEQLKDGITEEGRKG